MPELSIRPKIWAWWGGAVMAAIYLTWRRTAFLRNSEPALRTREAWVVGSLTDPYFQVHMVVLFAIVAALAEGRRRANPMELLRRSSWRRAALGCLRRRGGMVLQAEAIFLAFIILMTPDSASLCAECQSPKISLFRLIGAPISLIVGIITLAVIVEWVALTTSTSVAVSAAAVTWVLTVVGFKRPEYFGGLNVGVPFVLGPPFTMEDAQRALPQVVYSVALAVLLLGSALRLVANRDRPATTRAKRILSGTVGGLAGVYLLCGNGHATVADSYLHLWSGTGVDGLNIMGYFSLALLTLLPVVGWLVAWEPSLTAAPAMHLLRVGSPRRYLWRETLRGVTVSLIGYVITVFATAVLAAMWGRHWGRLPAAAWAVVLHLLLLGALGIVVVVLLVVIARLAGGPVSEAITLGGLVAAGAFLAPYGFPFAQHGLALLVADPLGPWWRAGILLATIAILALIIHTWVAARIRAHGIPEGAQQ